MPKEYNSTDTGILRVGMPATYRGRHGVIMGGGEHRFYNAMTGHGGFLWTWEPEGGGRRVVASESDFTPTI